MKTINPRALSLATTWTVVFIVVLTIWAELSKPFKTVLASMTGHHWVTKGIVAVIFFVIVYALLFKRDSNLVNSEKYVLQTVLITILAGLAIFSFFTWHFLTL